MRTHTTPLHDTDDRTGRRHMDRDQILALYDWRHGVCFRHPERGTVDTALVKTIHPRGNGSHEVRACKDCVITMEDIRRETAARSGSGYEPGHAGEEVR